MSRIRADWISQPKARNGSSSVRSRDDPRPLHVLVWGGIEDLAQALHDAPEILPNLRVYWIGGPNKKWSVNAYNYIEQNHPKLWMIEANATYRGWFVGGNQSGEWNNKAFVKKHIAGHGALGELFVSKKADIKMGDTPSLARLMRGVSDDPTQPSWGGKYVRIWDGRKTVFDRHTTAADKSEAFGVTEFVLPVPEGLHGQEQCQDDFLERQTCLDRRERGQGSAFPFLAARRESLVLQNRKRLRWPRRAVRQIRSGSASNRTDQQEIDRASELVDR